MRTSFVASFVLSMVVAGGAVLAGGCEQPPPSRAAKTEVVPVAAPAAPSTGEPATMASTAPGATAGEGMSCGGSCGGQCGGQSCGGGCMHGGPEVAMAPAPADAHWTSLHVTGMHCGGCARRIKRALASVTGVVGVEVDLARAEVRVATTGDDQVARITETIDGLGYQASAN